MTAIQFESITIRCSRDMGVYTLVNPVSVALRAELAAMCPSGHVLERVEFCGCSMVVKWKIVSKPRRIWNMACVKCEAVPLEMVLVGAVAMCLTCFSEEFVSDDPVHEERTKYLEWLHKRNAKLESDE